MTCLYFHLVYSLYLSVYLPEFLNLLPFPNISFSFGSGKREALRYSVGEVTDRLSPLVEDCLGGTLSSWTQLPRGGSRKNESRIVGKWSHVRDKVPTAIC